MTQATDSFIYIFVASDQTVTGETENELQRECIARKGTVKLYQERRAVYVDVSRLYVRALFKTNRIGVHYGRGSRSQLSHVCMYEVNGKY